MKWSDVNSNEGTVSRTSTSLLIRAKADDGDAWEQLVNTYSRRIYRWCRQAGLQPADAGNVVQEVLRAVARKLPDFNQDQQGHTFRGWLRRITQNKLRDHFRHLMRQPDQAVGGTDAHQRMMRLTTQAAEGDGDKRRSQTNEGTGNEHSNSERLVVAPNDRSQTSFSYGCLSDWGRTLVEEIRTECSERDWRFFWRVVVDGQSAVEVGKEFGVTANAVRLVKMRILRRLRENIAAASDRSNSHLR